MISKDGLQNTPGRDFAKLHRDVVFGKSGGKIIWQPRIGCWYEDKVFAGEPLPPPYTDMTVPQIYRSLDCSARIYDYNACYKEIEPPAVKQTKHQLNDTDYEITIHTPVGNQVCVLRASPNCPHPFCIKWPIETADEFKVATWRLENSIWRWDQSEYEQILAKWGALGAPTMFMPRVNVQDLFVSQMGTEKAIYAIYDWPDTVETYFHALEENHNRLIDVINGSPIEIINFGDNVHGGTLTFDIFKRYMLPSYQRRCEKLHNGGKFVHAHWDGDTKSLLPFATETGMDGIEAITPVPQGDVTLEEIKAGLGNDMFLIDGLPAILFDELYPVSMLEDYTHRIIELFAPKLILGISDEISSTGDIERIRIVGQIVDKYNAAIEAKN